jgi:hypothetical protein
LGAAISTGSTTTQICEVGARVIKMVAPVIAGSTFGTANISNRDWGYVAWIPVSQVGWYAFPVPGDHILVEGALETSGIPEFTQAWNVTLVEPTAER